MGEKCRGLGSLSLVPGDNFLMGNISIPGV
jgi:hypothetical protein